MKVKVLFLHKHFNQSGGVERVHQNLAHALEQTGGAPVFYVMNGYGYSEKGFTALVQKFTAYRNDENKGFLSNLKDIKQLTKNYDFDIIISATEKANLTAFIFKLINPKIKVIYTRHCAFDVSDQKLPPFAIKALYSMFALNGQIVAVSNALKKQIQQSLLWNKKRVHFVPNAVISEDIYKKSLEKNPEHIEKPYFIAVGRLVEQKGFDILLQAYAKALNIITKLPTLVILGEGEDSQTLQNQAKSLNISHKVIFAGFTSNPYAPIKNACCFILSSRHEGMPTVMIESLALNTPVIAFDCPTGPAEILNDQNGYLVDHLNIEALSKAILAYKKLPHDALEQWVENFRFTAVAKKYISISGVNTNE